jgi:hypothetical protein
VRRAVPWVLLGLLTVGTAAGIALGVANQPGPTPEQWLSSALAATVRAGSVRVTEHDVTSSSNPEARIAFTTSSLLDFTHAVLQETTVTRESVDLSGPLAGLLPKSITLTMEVVGRGRDVYTGFSTERNLQWEEEVFPRNASSFLYPDGTSTIILPGLNDLSPVTAVREAGAARIGGEATTKYLLSFAPTSECSGTKGAGSIDVNGYPQTVWIDREGRIVQERSVVRAPSSPMPAVVHHDSSVTRQSGGFTIFPLNSPRGTRTDVTTFRFTDFGAPVSIKTPSVPSRDIHRVSEAESSAKSVLCPAASYVLRVGSVAPGHHQSKAQRGMS